jgi:hypothetical protein
MRMAAVLLLAVAAGLGASDCSPSFPSRQCDWATTCTSGTPFWNTPYQGTSCVWHFGGGGEGPHSGTAPMFLNASFRTAYAVNVTVFDGPSASGPSLAFFDGREHPGADDGHIQAQGTLPELTVRLDAYPNGDTFGLMFDFTATSAPRQARLKSDDASHGASSAPCATDTDCPFDGQWRCCGATEHAENCPTPANATTGVGNCVLPGTTGKTQCQCVAGKCGTSKYYAAPKPGMKQWLMIGDSITGGCMANGMPKVSTSHGIQVIHSPGNAANVWWGAHCLDGWLGDPARWDVITFQFGLHDLALDNERIEPPTYTRLFANISQRIATLAPRAKLLWVTTTPVPAGIDGYCNKSNGQGGCPPRSQADPPIYNAAAAKAVASIPSSGRIGKLDLYSVVTATCGTKYTLCPEGCTEHGHGKTATGNCFQIPHNVHYEARGWAALVAAYMEAVLKAVTAV